MTLERYKVTESNDSYLRVNIPGNDSSLLNSLRKVILNNIPSMSITHVIITENTSSLVDEVLAHRLGLLQIFSDDLNFIQFEDEDIYDEFNSIKFSLNVEYSPKKNYVMSADLIWIPQGKQGKFLSLKPRVVCKDILLCKLARGQRIELEAYATKGCGEINAKFNVVSTCFYRREQDGNSFSFILETENGVDPELVLKRGINILHNKLAYSYTLQLSQKEETEDTEKDDKAE